MYLETYIERLKPNPVPEDLKEINELRKFLFQLRMDFCRKNSSLPLTLRVPGGVPQDPRRFKFATSFTFFFAKCCESVTIIFFYW